MKAQELRAAAALLAEWFRICVRMGYVGNHARRNPHQPVERDKGSWGHVASAATAPSTASTCRWARPPTPCSASRRRTWQRPTCRCQPAVGNPRAPTTNTLNTEPLAEDDPRAAYAVHTPLYRCQV